MTNEEIIKGLTKMLNNTIEANECGLSNNDFKDDIELLKSALSLIEKQEKEIENTKELYDRALSDVVKADYKNIIKDKQIDLYIDELICNEFDRCCQECCKECEKDKDTLGYCIKQYFADLVEKETKET